MKLKDKKVLLLGGSGFLAGHLIMKLKPFDIKLFTPSHKELDLTDEKATIAYFLRVRPQLVINCAGAISGLLNILKNPADLFDTNVRININVLKASRLSGAEKVVNIGSTCAYPGDLPTGYFREEEFLNGPMHPSVDAYGFSKRAMHSGSTAYRQQYGLNSITLLLTNMYGPGDVFSIDRAHVASALIKKFMVAKKNNKPTVEVLGTGKAIREFIYVEDAASAIIKAAELYNDVMPLNVGTGEEMPVAKLAEMIKQITGYKGQIVWNTSGPDGALRKVSDITRIKRMLHWKPKYYLKDGLKKTITWFNDNYESAVSKV